MKNWTPVDFVVFALAFVIALALGVSTLNNVLYKIPLSPERADIVDRIYIGIISIVSLYVGAKVANNNKNKKDD